ncbi:MAG TPA: DUF4870 domain-containing protein [Vicinamibacteria bacterium]|nr:DUF4870 domain-containing protein [Vicinamibacteria bacterium]
MASPTPGKTQLGLESNVAGLLCYMPLCCLGFVFSIVVIIVEKQNRFVKFHAFQSLLVWGASMVVLVGVWIASIVASMVSGLLGMLVSLLGLVVCLAVIALTVLLMIKAYNNEEYALPTLGELARKWASQ